MTSHDGPDAGNGTAGAPTGHELGAAADGRGVPPTISARAPVTPVDVTIADLIRSGGLGRIYQPLIDLETGDVVGHEALLRGPAGTPWRSPLMLLAAAREHGLLVDLERQSLRESMADVARQAGGAAVTLFVNVEPSTLTESIDTVLEALDGRPRTVRVVVEITERALVADPAGVIAGAARLRAAGCAIALDDVGVEPESLAFIPLLRPEVVKLDLGLLRTADDPRTITVAGAVRAYAEESGADVVAEGIETADDLTRALVLGATIGQGWWWGQGSATLGPCSPASERFSPVPDAISGAATPWDLVDGSRSLRRAPKRLLLPVSKTLEIAAQEARVPPLMVSCFQHARFYAGRTAQRYASLADRLPLVGGLGAGVPAAPTGDVRWSSLATDDPLTREWTVVTLGAHEAYALVARDAGSDGVDEDREFTFLVTHDRALVTSIAHVLVRRISPR